MGGVKTMMTYWWINFWFLAGTALAVLVGALLGVRLRWVAVAVGLVIMLTLTAVFDNLIIGFGLVDYDPAKISGVRLGVAPVEDFAYTVVAMVLVPLIWVALRTKRKTAS